MRADRRGYGQKVISVNTTESYKMKTLLKLTPAQAIALRDQLNSMDITEPGPGIFCWHTIYADTTEAKQIRPPAKAKDCLAKRRYVFLSKDAVGSILSDSLSELQDRSMSGAAYDAICAAVRRNDGAEIFLHHEELNFEGDDYDWVLAVQSGKKVYQLYGLHPADEMKPV